MNAANSVKNIADLTNTTFKGVPFVFNGLNNNGLDSFLKDYEALGYFKVSKRRYLPEWIQELPFVKLLRDVVYNKAAGQARKMGAEIVRVEDALFLPIGGDGGYRGEEFTASVTFYRSKT